MEYLLSVVLTTALSLGIIKIMKKEFGVKKTLTQYRQSDIHNVLKYFFSETVEQPVIKSQLLQRIENNRIRVVASDDKAYWVQDNVFYVSSLVNGLPDMETAQPIDTTNMSKEDIDKMLFILDNLGGRNNNERRSTGNE